MPQACALFPGLIPNILSEPDSADDIPLSSLCERTLASGISGGASRYSEVGSGAWSITAQRRPAVSGVDLPSVSGDDERAGTDEARERPQEGPGIPGGNTVGQTAARGTKAQS